jgi:endonuclease VIII
VPEGDTIWRAARALDRALAGKTVRSFRSSLPVVSAAAERLRLVGRALVRVEARGKHLLFVFGDGPATAGPSAAGPVLHTHQGMHGRWRIERSSFGPPLPGGPGRQPAQVTIDVGDVTARCRNAAVVELLAARSAAHHPALARLGPDVLAPGFDPTRARERLRARGELEIGVALLDQTALAGIGNVYKSEVLFLCGVAPRARVSELDDASLARLIETARRLMSANLGPGPRRTTSALSAERLFVYRRTGRPCRRCGGAIRRLVQGEQARATYFCPRCQRSGAPRETG